MTFVGKALLALYALCMRAFTPFAPLLLANRRRKGKELGKRSLERLAQNMAAPNRKMGSTLVWVHAASIGETNAVFPLCEKLSEQGHHVLLTTVTATSATMIRERLPANMSIRHQFAPFDAPSIITTFLDHWHPDLAIFVESEVWPVTLRELSRRKVPSVIVNARLSDRSFKRWSKLKTVAASLFGNIDHVFARGEEDLLRYQKLGVKRITITGNLKYDAPRERLSRPDDNELIEALRGRPIFLAASTHSGEDEVVLSAARQLQHKFDGLLTIIVPRHPIRASEIAIMGEEFGFRVARRSKLNVPDVITTLYVADTLGEMELFYQLANAAFIGGSLQAIGGHNPIEAVYQSCAVLHGPHISNFREVYGILQAADATVEVDGADQLADEMGRCLANPLHTQALCNRARTVFNELGGATNQTFNGLAPYLHLRDTTIDKVVTPFSRTPRSST